MDDDAGVGGIEGHQQGAGRDGTERIEAERLAELPALGEHGDALAVDAQADAGGTGELVQRGRDSALGRIVHGVHAGQLARQLGLGTHADAWRAQKALGAPDDGRRHAARTQLGLFLARDDGRALQRHALGQHDRVADARAARRHQLVLGDLAEHRARHDRTIETVRHLGVTADERDLELVARLGELAEERAHAGLVRGARYDDVVGVDVQRVPAELVGRERDGIARDDQVAIADVDDGGVLADARPHDHPRIARRVLVENRLQQIAGKLPEWQARHRA